MDKDYILNCYSDSIIIEGFDKAIIGISINGQVIYDIQKMMNILMDIYRNDLFVYKDIPEGLNEEDALNYLDNNIFNVYYGEFTPIFIYVE